MHDTESLRNIRWLLVTKKTTNTQICTGLHGPNSYIFNYFSLFYSFHKLEKEITLDQ